jgi:hypothetical protein
MTRKLHVNAPEPVQILIDNYRESREEGIRLVHSAFTDVTFAVALLGSIITGGLVANEPRLLLLIPVLIGAIGIYGIQKLRVSNLITCYMIYLEREINKAYSDPVMIWNSEFVRRNVSAGRQSIWGHTVTAFVVFGFGVIYSGICYWPYTQNVTSFLESIGSRIVYLAVCATVFIFNVVGILSVLRTTKRYSPDHVDQLIKRGKIGYSK